jgi:spore photoproduct lyase
MEGCPFDCSYCILQAYLPHKNIQVSSNTDAITTAINTLIHEGEKRRLGTGELSDSLALDNIFPFSRLITPLINKQDVIQFEFKTKSANIANLLDLNPKNIVVSWSLNPPEIAMTEEHGAAPIHKRLEAAKLCADAGYRIGFHFDPLIAYEGWQKGYGELLATLFNTVPESSVEYISISTFRTTAALMDRMRERPEPSRLLRGDMIAGLDGKQRYFKALRAELLGYVTNELYRHWRSVFVYYCMEHESLWKNLLGFDPGEREEMEELFPYRRGI